MVPPPPSAGSCSTAPAPGTTPVGRARGWDCCRAARTRRTGAAARRTGPTAADRSTSHRVGRRGGVARRDRRRRGVGGGGGRCGGGFGANWCG